MSGDVQPRKRKDKKRKKDDSTELLPPQLHQPPLTASTPSDDVNIHVHKEDGTGGGICAKIVFFLLFSALAVLIGLIITEHRGSTDLDAIDTDSKFSQLFEGWTDNTPSHDDELDHIADSLEDHDSEGIDSHEVEEELDEDHDDEDHDDEDAHSEEESEPEDEVSEETSEPDNEEETLESEEQSSENINEIDEEESEENENLSENLSEADPEENIESEEQPEEENTNISEEETEDPENGDQSKEIKDENDIEEPEEQTDDNENSKMVVKIGVGVALLVVAHVVLVRKWNPVAPSGPAPVKDEPLPDLSRRNTIVVPPAFQEVEQDIEEIVEEDYSDEEEGETESEDDRPELKSAKLKYQELRTTYTRSLTPESEPTEKGLADDEEYEGSENELDEESSGEIEESEEEYDEDEELLKRLEAKYGQIKRGKRDNPEIDNNEEDFDEQFSSWKRVNVPKDNESEASDSDKPSDDETYEYENITNKDDWKIKEKIDEADKTIKNNVAYAIKLFDVLLQKYPTSPRSLYGKAHALDLYADRKKSNDLLQQSINYYLQTLELTYTPEHLFQLAAERCINRLRFIGNYRRAIDVHKKLITRFPNEPKHRNQLAVTYLTMNRVNEAKILLKETLTNHPEDGFALVHYGFILKTAENKLNESVSYLKSGIATNSSGAIDGRFYFHLGDALARLGQNNEAMKVYEEGVQRGLFLSKYQRSLYNVARLKGKPWWQKTETPYSALFSALESNWIQIRDEGLSVLSKSGHFQSESENLKDTGDWKQFELFSRGHKHTENCKKCPITCKIIDTIPDAKLCRRGQTKFSVMHPGTHVWPHCGPTNCRLRVHLGLNVPPKTYIRVADEIRSWENGKVLIFDDSFEHEVWHNGSTFRLVLIVDVWHPELTPAEKRGLTPI